MQDAVQPTTPPQRPVRVAMCGTFDVKNYGDLLFPSVLRHELGKRIPGLEVECFSYHAKAPPHWPFAVSPIDRLPDAIHSFDGVVIGGGHLVRFDKQIAPGYIPPSPALHHPTAYWLLPALLAMERRIPVIWSGVGVSPELPAWGREILKEVLPASAYVSVRDAASQHALEPLANAGQIHTIPDTVFGIANLPRLHDAARQTDQPYVVIQATPHLVPHAQAIRQFLKWLNHHHYRVVLLPVAPVLGDLPECMKAIVGSKTEVISWDDPMEAARVIAGASAVAGVSLHLSITAFAFGVPVLRPFETTLVKYHFMHHFPRVFSLERYIHAPGPLHQAIQAERLPSAKMLELLEALRAHWCHVAEILVNPGRPAPAGLVSLLKRLPFLLEKE